MIWYSLVRWMRRRRSVVQSVTSFFWLPAARRGVQAFRWRLLSLESLEGRVLLAVGDLRIVTYNVIGGSGSVSPDLGTVLSAIGSESYAGRSRPIDVLALQEVDRQSTTTAAVVNQLNAIYGAGIYAGGTLNGTALSGGDTVGLVFNTLSVQLVGELGIGTPSITGQARQTIRYQLRPLGVSPVTDFYLYNSHFKASTGSENESRRQVEASAVRANADSLPEGTHIIYAGDFNVYRSSEAAIQTLLAAGNGRAVDPVNRLGNWSNNSSFIDVMTQAPAIDPPGALVGGGLDDRFDFQLQSQEWTDGLTLEYVSGTYRAFGNNGSVALNSAINHPSNTALASLPNRSTILDLLTTVSDHLPVVADFTFVSTIDEPWVAYSSGPYVQNFDGLPATGTFTLASNGPLMVSDAPIVATGMRGWQIANVGGSATLRFNPGTGSSTTSSIYSFGSANSTERALGSIAASTNIGAFGFALTNRSGQMLTTFELSYAGEKWREGGSNTPDTLSFSYAVGGESITLAGTSSFVTVPALDFISPTVSTSATALNGNLPTNRTVLSAKVSGFQWLPEQRLVLRWVDVDDNGSDDGLSIDDLVFSASPPPAVVLDRRVYYPKTTFDTSLNSQEAIDTSRLALRSGVATTDHMTAYVRGLTGIIIDVQSMPATVLLAEDFLFRIGNDTNPEAWPLLPSGALDDAEPIVVLPGLGIEGSDRIKIQFDFDAIRNTWLQVSLLANARTGLATPDVFYFGNAAADIVNTTSLFRVNATDVSATRQAAMALAGARTDASQRADLNKDGRVNATDTSLARQRSTGTQVLANLDLGGGRSLVVDESMARTGWLLPEDDQLTSSLLIESVFDKSRRRWLAVDRALLQDEAFA
jgi:endonuclease/exonuclease/phosphatase family metal-dependent hydrolase